MNVYTKKQQGNGPNLSMEEVCVKQRYKFVSGIVEERFEGVQRIQGVAVKPVEESTHPHTFDREQKMRSEQVCA